MLASVRTFKVHMVIVNWKLQLQMMLLSLYLYWLEASSFFVSEKGQDQSLFGQHQVKKCLRAFTTNKGQD